MELILLPFIAAFITFMAKGKTAKLVAILSASFQLVLTAIMLFKFNAAGNTNFELNYPWIPQMGINFRIGFDGISMMLAILTNILSFLIIFSSNRDENDRAGLFYGLILLMQSALIGVFTSLNGFVFYLFWELALIPIYLICGIWGEGSNKIQITLKFFIYTFAGSLLMLASLIYLAAHANGSFDYEALFQAQLSDAESLLVALGFFIAFAIKMPVFPFHTWQPQTYTMAPAQGSMLLSGIMLKMGVYGVIRWMIPLVPKGVIQFQSTIIILAIIGIVYGAIIAIRQNDLKKIIAYSSFSHVGLIAAGAFVFSLQGIQGSMIQMFCHGINIVGLFFAIDIIEKRTGTRDIKELGGIVSSAPRFAILFMVVLLGSVAVPLTNGFIGEFLLLKAVFDYQAILALVAGLTVIFCAVYMLRIYQLAIFGEVKEKTTNFEDLNWMEFTTLGIIGILVLAIGVYPQWLLNLTEASVMNLIK
ncbi:MAG: NADH-quinone oxidoreductase subunit M [Bacteroidetes bacterium]|nr:NADH-quinone oxidoreductase subunit M [Bacteroidota bacterium]MBP7477269.1 NADH-quinone oxidoreductase subunit M [Chitinophagales bacterium]